MTPKITIQFEVDSYDATLLITLYDILTDKHPEESIVSTDNFQGLLDAISLALPELVYDAIKVAGSIKDYDHLTPITRAVLAAEELRGGVRWESLG